jgi:hypothetical protein
MCLESLSWKFEKVEPFLQQSSDQQNQRFHNQLMIHHFSSWMRIIPVMRNLLEYFDETQSAVEVETDFETEIGRE